MLTITRIMITIVPLEFKIQCVFIVFTVKYLRSVCNHVGCVSFCVSLLTLVVRLCKNMSTVKPQSIYVEIQNSIQ